MFKTSLPHKMCKIGLHGHHKHNIVLIVTTFGITSILQHIYLKYSAQVESDLGRSSPRIKRTRISKPSLSDTSYKEYGQLHSLRPIFISNGSHDNLSAINVTIVTAFFDIGNFQKGGVKVDSSKYYDWARQFRYLLNPLVVYTDSRTFQQHVETIRETKGRTTQVKRFDRSTSWAFQNNERIKTIFDRGSYPKHHPNTVNSLYTCSQHAKYEVLASSVHEKPFDTKYYMWLDIGYFRNRKSYKPFYLERPSDFDDTKVAMTLVDPRKHLNNQPKTIILSNDVWVGGRAVFGKRTQIATFTADFKRAVEFFLSKEMTNTDQQIIYAMYSPKGRENIRPEVELQLYQPPPDWFYLGNSMVRDAT